MELSNPGQTENKDWSILVYFMENKRLNVEVLQKIAQSFEDLSMREPEFFDFTLTHFAADQLPSNTFFHLETSTSSVPVEVDFDAKNPQGDSGSAGNEVVGPHVTSSEHKVIQNPDNSPNNSPKLPPVTHFLEEICIPFKTHFVPLENQPIEMNARELLKNIDMSSVQKEDIFVEIPGYGKIVIHELLSFVYTFYVDKVFKLKGYKLVQAVRAVF